MGSGDANLTLIGTDRDLDSRAIAAFAGRNRIPFRTLDIDDPTPHKLAGLLGMDLDLHDDTVNDVLIVGGGPGGIAAAVYAGA